MPNGKFPLKVAKKMGISEKQLAVGLIVNEIGNPYSASSLIGLCRVLDKVKSGEKILLTSYGSGSGSDSFSFVGV
jgi:hydroxymethylglutaryl-CoA synthase